MKDILVGIPCLSGAWHTKLAIDSVSEEADILLIDNDAEKEVKDLLDTYPQGYIKNQKNVYVNAAWNQILEVFLISKRSTLIIMNSDLVMSPGWSNKLVKGNICIPTDGSHTEDVVVTEGTPGVFIHLNREMANIIYPLPDYIKIWFGDQFIYSVLRQLGYKTVVTAGLLANHVNGGSQNVNIVPDKDKIIAEDKRLWGKYGELDIQQRVNEFKKW